MNTATIQLPYRLECFGQTGWTVATFTARDAAVFVLANPQAAMPCWRRFDIVNGELIQTR